jgi:hypothetical protein
LIISEQNTRSVPAPYGDADPHIQPGATAYTLACRVNAHRC